MYVDVDARYETNIKTLDESAKEKECSKVKEFPLTTNNGIDAEGHAILRTTAMRPSHVVATLRSTEKQ